MRFCWWWMGLPNDNYGEFDDVSVILQGSIGLARGWRYRHQCVWGKFGPYGKNWIFSSRMMRLARIVALRNCLMLRLSIWETCLATWTAVGMAIAVMLIVPGARWASAIRTSEARKASLNVLLACFVRECEVRSRTPELIVDTLSVVPGTKCCGWTDHSQLKASVVMFPPAKTARLCHTMKMMVKLPLTFKSLSPTVRGNGLAKHTEANMMKPASIKQNRKKRVRILTIVFLPTTSRGSGVALHESCSSSFCMRFTVCNSDVEIWFIMRAVYDSRMVECYRFPVLWRYHNRDQCLGSVNSIMVTGTTKKVVPFYETVMRLQPVIKDILLEILSIAWCLSVHHPSSRQKETCGKGGSENISSILFSQ